MKLVLLGNKLDNNFEREVDFEEARMYAIKNQMVFREISAKQNIGIDSIFKALGEKLFKDQKKLE